METDGVKWTFSDSISGVSGLMSAFLQSGRSDRQKLGEIRVRFRPIAVVDINKKAGWNTPAQPGVWTTATLLLGTAARRANRRDDGVFLHIRDQAGRYEFFTGLRNATTVAP